MPSRIACPCCGYRTLPSGPGDYEVCAVCGWEDDGAEPWAVGGPNGDSLVEAQLRYLSEGRLLRWWRHHRGRSRGPRPVEERDRGWRPFEDPDDLLERVAQVWVDLDEEQRRWESDPARIAAQHESDAEVDRVLEAYNAASRELAREAAHLPLALVDARLLALGRSHGFMAMPDAERELIARGLQDEHWRRRHPVQVVSWCWRHRRTATLRTRLQQALTGAVRFTG